MANNYSLVNSFKYNFLNIQTYQVIESGNLLINSNSSSLSTLNATLMLYGFVASSITSSSSITAEAVNIKLCSAVMAGTASIIQADSVNLIYSSLSIQSISDLNSTAVNTSYVDCQISSSSYIQSINTTEMYMSNDIAGSSRIFNAPLVYSDNPKYAALELYTFEDLYYGKISLLQCLSAYISGTSEINCTFIKVSYVSCNISSVSMLGSAPANVLSASANLVGTSDISAKVKFIIAHKVIYKVNAEINKKYHVELVME